MPRNERRLLRHLTLAIVVKLVLLMVLWWIFVRDARVPVSAESTAAHLGATSTPAGEQP